MPTAIVADVAVWPWCDPTLSKTLVRLVLIDDGEGTSEEGNYLVYVGDEHVATLNGFPRTNFNAVELLYMAMETALGDEKTKQLREAVQIIRTEQKGCHIYDRAATMVVSEDDIL